MAGVQNGASCMDHLANLMYFLLTSEHLLWLLWSVTMEICHAD